MNEKRNHIAISNEWKKLPTTNATTLITIIINGQKVKEKRARLLRNEKQKIKSGAPLPSV